MTSEIYEITRNLVMFAAACVGIEAVAYMLKYWWRIRSIRARRTCQFSHTWSKPFPFTWLGDHYIGHRCLRCPKTKSDRQCMSDGAAFKESEKLKLSNSGRLVG
jgi:hypothetical protein